jgi:bifunctional non-homologous end joining protein LigD
MAAHTKQRSLKTYNAKRDFKKTAEPEGKAPKKTGNSYLIQKHAATRLHYDFRLEHAGVLLSWSVPKGPSLNTKDRRLAVRTEDHPVAYGRFEGTIPKGEYGGGSVMLWDRGTWTPHGDVEAGLRNGELKFTLHGERLTGDWVLVRMNVERGRENWLLIKERDDVASETRQLVDEFDVSVTTGRSMEEIATGASAVWHSNRTPKENLKAMETAAQADVPRKRTKATPSFVKPQLATLVSDAPDGDSWLHEIKFDGYRVLCAIGKGGVRIYTRNDNDWTAKFAALVPDLEKLDADAALIDGEVCVLDDEGKTDFKRLQNALREGAEDRLTLFVFDLLSLNGEDLKKKPLLERKEGLRDLLAAARPSGALRYSDHVIGRGPAFFEQACKAGLEGIISKKADGKYVSARSPDWLKTKCIRRQEFVVAGYSPSDKDSRGIASLVLGVWNTKGDRLCYAGRVGTGFTQAQTYEWKKLLDAARTDNPFSDIPRSEARGVVFAKPENVVEVEFLEWTNDGRLRHPSFIARRQDKPARSIVKETPKPPPPSAVKDNGRAGANRSAAKKSPTKKSPAKKAAAKKAASKKSSATGAASASSVTAGEAESVGGVRLTHPDRILYPDQGVTKRELAEYYLRIQERILPFLVRRPISIVRCPQGQAKECFFQRHIHAGSPKELGQVTVPEREGEGDYLLIETPQALVAAVQIGALELHPWGARVDNFEKPDMMIFDLDPDPGLDFEAVKQGARDVLGVLEAVGLQSFLKTTGGKGLHVVAPLTRRREWPEVKAFARAVAERMAESDAGRYVAVMAKKKRVGRIFVDYLRNDRMNTAVAPYSSRARVGATVSTPLFWDELDGLESAAVYNINNIEDRLESLRSDPWADFFKTKQTITASAMKAVGVG